MVEQFTAAVSLLSFTAKLGLWSVVAGIGVGFGWSVGYQKR